MVLQGNPQCGVEVDCGSVFLERLTFVYDAAWWHYPYKIFDNSGPTWLTDYALCLFMLYGFYTVKRDTPPSPLRNRTLWLLALYALSVLTGGIGHQFFVTPAAVLAELDDLKRSSSSSSLSPLVGEASAANLNTWQYRFVWTLCIGAVCAGGGVIGSIACQIGRAFPTSEGNGSGASSPSSSSSQQLRRSPRHKGKSSSFSSTAADSARKVTALMGVQVGVTLGMLAGTMLLVGAAAALPASPVGRVFHDAAAAIVEQAGSGGGGGGSGNAVKSTAFGSKGSDGAGPIAMVLALAAGFVAGGIGGGVWG